MGSFQTTIRSKYQLGLRMKPLSYHNRNSYGAKRRRGNQLIHCRRLVKIIGWANQNIGGQKVVKMINAWAFLNYWGHVPGLPPKSTPMSLFTGS